MAEIHLFAAARAAVGASVVEVDAGPLARVLDDLAGAQPGFAAVRPRCSFLVDGIAVHGEDAAVGAGDRVDVLPPFSGG